MKKFITLFSLIIALLCCVGCADGNLSSSNSSSQESGESSSTQTSISESGETGTDKTAWLLAVDESRYVNFTYTTSATVSVDGDVVQTMEGEIKFTETGAHDRSVTKQGGTVIEEEEQSFTQAQLQDVKTAFFRDIAYFLTYENYLYDSVGDKYTLKQPIPYLYHGEPMGATYTAIEIVFQNGFLYSLEVTCESQNGDSTTIVVDSMRFFDFGVTVL